MVVHYANNNVVIQCFCDGIKIYMDKELVHLVRLALEGRQNDVAALAKRIALRLRKNDPRLSKDIQKLLASYSTITRSATGTPLPVDADSRLELLKREVHHAFEIEPIWSKNVLDELLVVLKERDKTSELAKAGVSPTRSILFFGPPGVGKTLAARWIAARMKKPLLTLDLATVMSSFLGKTGGNIRTVLNYACTNSTVLLLDEFDAIAKRRDDSSDVGELKRLVTVLLQAIDEWPSSSMLLAATNHPELLDPAVWRRFDRVIEFPKPNDTEIFEVISGALENTKNQLDTDFLKNLSSLLSGLSHSDVVRLVNVAKRLSVINKLSLEESLLHASTPIVQSLSTEKKLQLAQMFKSKKISQRQISELTSLSRDTIRKHLSDE